MHKRKINSCRTGKKRNKKGNAVLEGLTILLVVTIFAVGGVFSLQIFDELNTDIQNSDDIGTNGKETSNSLFEKFPDLIDNLFLMAYVLFMVFTIISSFVIDTHPIFFIASLILIIGVFVTAIFVGNAYNDIVSDTETSFYANQMPYMSWVMRHIAENIIGVVFLITITLFVKFKLN